MKGFEQETCPKGVCRFKPAGKGEGYFIGVWPELAWQWAALQ